MNMVKPMGLATMSPALIQADRYHAWIFDLLRPFLGKNILECGTGAGILTRQLLSTGADRVMTVDICQACLNALDDVRHDSRLIRKSVDLGESDLARTLSLIGWDSIVMINVLEHLAEDAKVVRQIASLLGAEGVLLLVVPAFASLYGPMDADAGHYRRYSGRDVKALMEAAGLKTVQCSYINPIGFLGWWLTNRIFKNSGVADPAVNARIRFFNRWLVSASRCMTPLSGMFFGQSVFAVGKR